MQIASSITSSYQIWKGNLRHVYQINSAVSAKTVGFVFNYFLYFSQTMFRNHSYYLWIVSETVLYEVLFFNISILLLFWYFSVQQGYALYTIFMACTQTILSQSCIVNFIFDLKNNELQYLNANTEWNILNYKKNVFKCGF